MSLYAAGEKKGLTKRKARKDEFASRDEKEENDARQQSDR